MAFTDEWTEEKCLELIREFRARPILWDQRDPLFFKKCMKPKAWQEIGDIVNIPPDICKHKMIILMSSFRREKSKILNSINEKADPSQTYKSTWFAFKDMIFLMDKDNERKRQIKTPEEVNGNESVSINNTMLSNFIAPPVVPNKKSRPNPKVTSDKAVAKKVAAAMRAEEVNISPPPSTPPPPTPPPPPAPKQTPAERDQEIRSFTSFIGNKMKNYSDTTKNAVQQAICDIIFKAGQNDYEPTNSYDKFTIIDDDADPLNREMYDEQSGTVFKIQNVSEDSE